MMTELVFIMGDHRSGTTLLYQLLAATGGFNVVTAYHVINFDQVLADHGAGRSAAARCELAARLGALGISDRKLDGVIVSPDLPEEYGFLLEDGPQPRLRAHN
ncbi:MAG: sulfotransferase, partial [Oscillochloris sp.]|nr:sulfotransferase [Oscillochloris sp.]